VRAGRYHPCLDCRSSPDLRKGQRSEDFGHEQVCRPTDTGLSRCFLDGSWPPQVRLAHNKGLGHLVHYLEHHLCRNHDLGRNLISYTKKKQNSCCSLNGSYAAASGGDGSSILYNVHKGSILTRLKDEKQPPAAITDCAWGAAENTLATCCRGGKITLWAA
jgi:WD40 repeat protein